MKTVHLIFKTHLDFGFTDFSATVFRRYREQFIPQALDLAREMRERGGPERFVWTTGSWLIYEFLERADSAARRRMEAAIVAGDIAWHALPYTTHTELMDASLFRFGLSLSQELDRRFGRKTTAAKMTDVPGHCRAIVPLLAEAGVQFLHIGVNPACSPPQVPPVFRWRAPDGSEIIVAYSSDYGTPFQGRAKELDDTLVFNHTGDNRGVPPMGDILQDFQKRRDLHPGANVIGSTLDAYAKKIVRHRALFPLVTAEIGDTWIHGTGSDPLKVAGYRALCRLRNQWEQDGRAEKYRKAFRHCSRFLMNVAEHTWGMDEKTHLGDYVNYASRDFARALKRDLVSPGVPPEYKQYGGFKQNSHHFDGSRRLQRFSTFAASWDEQRAYVRDAVKALAGTPLQAEARKELRQPSADRPALRGFKPLPAKETIVAGKFHVRFDRVTGALIHLRSEGARRSVCAPKYPLGLFRYQTFSQGDYDRYVGAYAVHLDRHAYWALADLTKPGIDKVRPRPRHAFFLPRQARLYFRRRTQADEVIAALKMPAPVCREAGAPRTVFLRYLFSRTAPVFALELLWFDKTATRLPEAAWLSFQPKVDRPAAWQMEKMGEWFSPLEVCSKGNRNLHAIGREIRHTGKEGQLTIGSLDAPLVAPGAPRLLEFDNTQPPLQGGMHFNLHNNIWGTNFPMWYGDNARFRFTVSLTQG